MKNLYFIIFMLCCSFAEAQVFTKDTITNNGAFNNRIKLVYLGDGYMSGEMNVFINDLNTINTKLFQTSPFKEYKNYFNVFAVRVPSAASGAIHQNNAGDCPTNPQQPVSNPSTYFGSKFDYAGIHRLVVPQNFATMQSVLASNYPDYNQVMLIVNSDYYGGSGGSIATSTKHASAAEISIHELGHSFAALADEYWAGAQYAAEKPNMTAQSNPTLVKWKNWVGTNGVGVFPYNGGPTWYRPVGNSQCKMEVLGVPFCNVCKETIIEKIHSLVQPVDSYFPNNSSVINANGEIGFKVKLVQPDPNTLKVTWKLDGNTFANNVDTVTIANGSLTPGNHVVTATVLDTTALTRSDNHLTAHAHTISWNLSITTGVVNPEISSVKLKVYPNPFVDVLNINYELKKKSDVKIELVNLLGQVVTKKEFNNQVAGKYSTTLDTKKSEIANGFYFLVFTVNGNRIVEEKIKIMN